jgi:hypothetical protein
MNFIPLEGTARALMSELKYVASDMPWQLNGDCIVRFTEVSIMLLELQSSLAMNVDDEVEITGLIKEIAVTLESAADSFYARKNAFDRMEAQTRHLIH